MADLSRVITTGQKVFKEEAKELIKKGQEFIKGGKTRQATELLEKKKLPVSVGDKKTQVVEGAETSIKVSKKDFKVKKPKVSEDQADEALFLYKGTAITPKILDDFNINKFSSKKDFIKFIDIISKQSKSAFDKQKRGVQTHSDTKRLATILQKNPESLQASLLSLKPGQTLNAQWIFAARELLESGMVKLDVLANKASTGTIDDVLKFRQHFALMGEFQKVLKGVQTETARALNQFKIPTRSKKYASVDLDELNKQSLIVEMGGEEDIRAVAQLYLNAGNQTAKARITSEVGVLANFRKASDSIAEIFLNAILSNPITHVRNSAGNWITQGINNFERKAASRWFGGKEIGGVAEWEDLAKVFGKKMAAEEMLAALSQTIKKKGFGKFLKEFDQNIQSNFGGTSKIELRPGRLTAANFNVENKKIAGGVDFIGNLLTLGRVPTRFLTTMDNWFKNQEYRSELYALAYRETLEMWRQGWLRRNNMAEYLADRVLNPTKAAQKSAYDAAHYVTYQTKLSNKGGKLQQYGKHLQGMKNNAGFMSWLSNYYLPFVQTPTNIASFVSERTPGLAQLLTKYNDDIIAGGARAQMAKTRLYLGSLFYTTFATAGYFGVAGGSDVQLKGATRGSKHQMMKALGYQTNSLRIPIGNGEYKQINLTGLDPLNMMVSMAANSGQVLNLALQNHDQAQDITAHTLALTLGFGEVLSNSTYLMGVSNMTRDVQNLYKTGKGDLTPGQFGTKWWNKFSSSFVPGIAKQSGKIWTDDFQKQALEWNEWMLRNINESNLSYDYNIFGEKIEKFGFISSYKKSPASDLLKEVNPELAPFDRSIPYSFPEAKFLSVSVPLKTEELAFWKQNAGLLFKQNLETAMKTDAILSDPNSDVILREAVIKRILSKSRSLVKEQFLSPTITNEQGEEIDNPFLGDFLARANELKLNKQITEQGGKSFIRNDNININN